MIGIRGGVGGNAGPVSLSPSRSRLGGSMRDAFRITRVWFATTLLAMIPAAGHAAAANRCGWMPRSLAVAPETSESRIADWIVDRILKLAADSDPILEISGAEAAAATGADLDRVDAVAVAQRVRERLRELSRQPVVAHESPSTDSVPPPVGAAPETSAAVPETQN